MSDAITDWIKNRREMLTSPQYGEGDAVLTATTALDALEAVLKRHTPHTETDCVDHWSECFIGGDSKCHIVGCCRNCRATFPCLTVQAINVALGVDDLDVRVNLGPDPLDPHGDGTIRKGDPLYDLLMNSEVVHAQRVGNSDVWDVTTRNAKPRRKTSRWGNLHPYRKDNTHD